MMSVKSLEAAAIPGAISSSSAPSGGVSAAPGGSVMRSGYLKKLKTYRKKFFVLRAETADSSARLEYYDTERKFLNGQPPKRSISLKNCFNINRRSDTKYKHVIALYTKDDCFCIVLETEEDTEGWLKALLSLQHGEEVVDGETPKPTFEHVWQVTVLNRGLGTEGLTGSYRLCLTDKTLSLIKKDEVPHIELNLSNIRSCGNLKDFFFLEIGRSSSLGAGELWMQTEDNNIAQNVHSTVYHAMRTNSTKEELGPKSRNRSSSATESSKPSTVGGVRSTKQVHAPKCHILSQDTPQSTTDTQAPSCSSSQVSQHPVVVGGVASLCQHLIQRGTSKTSERRHSLSAGGVTTWSGNIISHQRTRSLPLANPAPCIINDQNTTTTNCSNSQPPSSRANSNNKRSTTTNNQSSKCMAGGVGPEGRERCDSMPSRARTTSEGGGNHNIQMLWNNSHQPRPHLLTYRPQSLYGRDISHSPPSGSPISPPSTDSAGSSYSLADENDVCPATSTDTVDQPLGRYGHSLTPDEAIAEEDCCPDSPGLLLYGISPNTGNYVPMAAAAHSSDDGYVDMSPRGRSSSHHNNSPTASLSSVTSGTPSTDMRFVEYPLEKVISYFTPAPPPPPDDEDSARPARAYSVGSRPETYRYKKYMELIAGGNDLRARAFSVGSKTKKMPGKVLPPHNHYNNVHPGGAKSSSAPILSSRMQGGSHSSIGPMDDLMEMDFSRSGSINSSGYMDMRPGSKTSGGNGGQQQKNNASGYVEMKPLSGGRANNSHPQDSPYVDMTSGSPAKSHFVAPPSLTQNQENNDTTSTVTSSSSKTDDYLDMDPRNKSRTTSQSSTTSATTNNHHNNHNNNNNNNNKNLEDTGYIEMTFNNKGNGSAAQISTDDYQISPARSCFLQGSPSNHHLNQFIMDDEPQFGSPPKPSSSSSSVTITDQPLATLMNDQQQQQMARTPEGYVEMSIGRSGVSNSVAPTTLNNHYHQRQSSLDSQLSLVQQPQTNEDYANISVVNSIQNAQKSVHHNNNGSNNGGSTNHNKKTRERERKLSGRRSSEVKTATAHEKARSQPINIVQNPGSGVGAAGKNNAGGMASSSSSPRYSMLAGGVRKYSTGGTPPHPHQMHLPLNSSPFSSLPRQQRARKNSSNGSSRRDSRDSCSSSSVTTPSSSSTIFPMSLNSPCSPVKQETAPASGSSSCIKVPASVLNAVYNNNKKQVAPSTAPSTNKTSNNSDYILMGFDSSKVATGVHHHHPHYQNHHHHQQQPKNITSYDRSAGDYVNYNPATGGVVVTMPTKPPTSTNSTPTIVTAGMAPPQDSGDYAIMKPTPATCPLAISLMNRLTSMSLAAGDGHHQSRTTTSCFRPINESKDDQMASETSGTFNNLSDCQQLQQPSSVDPAYEVLRTPPPRPSSVTNDNSLATQQQQPQMGVVKSRPSSVAESSRSSLSRPSSASSELCCSTSSGSTVICGNSRPDSVNGDRIRPSSVNASALTNNNSGSSSSDIVVTSQLHYASLDLDDCPSAVGGGNSAGNKSPRTVKNNPSSAAAAAGVVISSGGAQSCDLPGQQGQSNAGSEPVTSYAAIDFDKSEALKQNVAAAAGAAPQSVPVVVPAASKVKH